MPTVVHVTSVHCHEDNRILFKECASLARAGYKVKLVVGGGRREVREGVEVCPVGAPSNRVQRLIVTGPKVIRMSLRNAGDIYHLHDPELLPWGRVLRVLGKRVIFDMHENLPASLLTKQWMPSWMRRPASWFAKVAERILLAEMPVVFAEQSYAQYYPWIRRSVTVLNYPDLSKLNQIRTPKCAKFTIGYMGSVEELRGSVAIVRAVATLSAGNKDVECALVGDVSDRHKLELLSALPIRDRYRLTFHGWQAPQVGWRIVSSCHVGMAVLKAIPNYTESYPTKLFEYMALGLPVVSSDFPLYRNIVAKYQCGLCVDPSDARALAEALEQLRSHPEEASEMGERGRATVNELFAWSGEAAKLLAFYSSIFVESNSREVGTA